MTSEWAHKVMISKQLVMHVPTDRIGTIEQVFEAGEMNNVQEPCVRLSTGDFFLAREERFHVVTDAEARLYGATTEVLNTVLGELGALVNSLKVDKERALKMIATAFRASATSIAGPPPEAHDG